MVHITDERVCDHTPMQALISSDSQRNVSYQTCRQHTGMVLQRTSSFATRMRDLNSELLKSWGAFCATSNNPVCHEAQAQDGQMGPEGLWGSEVPSYFTPNRSGNACQIKPRVLSGIYEIKRLHSVLSRHVNLQGMDLLV